MTEKHLINIKMKIHPLLCILLSFKLWHTKDVKMVLTAALIGPRHKELKYT